MELEIRALERVPRDGVVGLGTGSTAERFLRALGERVRDGLKVRGVATSLRTEALARELGIPLVSLDDVESLDLAVDGADEIDPRLNLLKGFGGALVREKIVAAASKRVLILARRDKLVPRLGARGRLPVEVLPFGAAFAARVLAASGLPGVRRSADGGPYRTDNGNFILDLAVSAIEEPEALEAAIRAVPGVVGTGLFAGMAHEVLVEAADGSVESLRRPQ
jgi:ribose 5-phosphate isomerase A